MTLVEEMAAWYHAEADRTFEDVAHEFGCNIKTVKSRFRKAGVPGKARGQRPGKPQAHNVARERNQERASRKPYLDPGAALVRPSVRKGYR